MENHNSLKLSENGVGKMYIRRRNREERREMRVHRRRGYFNERRGRREHRNSKCGNNRREKIEG